MLHEIQISLENWNCKVMEHIYSDDYPSHCPLSRTSVVTKELLSERFGHLGHLGTSLGLISFLCPLPLIDHIGLDRRERTEAAEEKGEGSKWGKEEKVLRRPVIGGWAGTGFNSTVQVSLYSPEETKGHADYWTCLEGIWPSFREQNAREEGVRCNLAASVLQ